jgi:hypothetical protein
MCCQLMCLSNGQFYVNHFDVKETAYDIILFANIFLVFVRERMILLTVLFASE